MYSFEEEKMKKIFLVLLSVVMLLGAFGIANMWLAVFADVGVAVLAILNSMRMLISRGGK